MELPLHSQTELKQKNTKAAMCLCEPCETLRAAKRAYWASHPLTKEQRKHRSELAIVWRERLRKNDPERFHASTRRGIEQRREKNPALWAEQVATHIERVEAYHRLSDVEDDWIDWPLNHRITIPRFIQHPYSEGPATDHCLDEACVCKSPAVGEILWSLMGSYESKVSGFIAVYKLLLKGISLFPGQRPNTGPAPPMDIPSANRG